MSSDPAVLELMHAEIDGLNSEQESARLRKHLAVDPAAREQFTQLKELSETLARVEEVTPPDDLTADILEALRSRRAQQPVAAPSSGNGSPGWGRVWRYGYAFAAGLLVGGVALHWWSGTFPIDGSQVTGTMTDRTALTAPELELDIAQLHGAASVRRTAEGVRIDLDFEAREPVEIALAFDREAAGFRGFLQELDEVTSLELDENRIVWTQQGRQRLSLVLAPRSEAPTTVELRVFASGSLVHASPLLLPGTSGG